VRRPISIAKLPILKEAPEDARLLRRPGIVHIPSNTVHYVCGHCSTLLVVADEGQRLHVVIECRECGTLNDARL
jgi:RNase P subunit RPR2